MGSVNEEKAPVPLPSAPPRSISLSITIQPPLSRRGHGPALLLVVPAELDVNASPKTLDPPPLQKWAEEGFAVAQIQVVEDSGSLFQDDVKAALKSLAELNECDKSDSVGLIGTSCWQPAHYLAAPNIVDSIRHPSHS